MEADERRSLKSVGDKIAERYLVPCEICGNNTSSLSKRCGPCWAVEKHLEEYLKHSAGRKNVNDILMRLYADEL